MTTALFFAMLEDEKQFTPAQVTMLRKFTPAQVTMLRNMLEAAETGAKEAVMVYKNKSAPVQAPVQVEDPAPDPASAGNVVSTRAPVSAPVSAPISTQDGNWQFPRSKSRASKKDKAEEKNIFQCSVNKKSLNYFAYDHHPEYNGVDTLHNNDFMYLLVNYLKYAVKGKVYITKVTPSYYNDRLVVIFHFGDKTNEDKILNRATLEEDDDQEQQWHFTINGKFALFIKMNTKPIPQGKCLWTSYQQSLNVGESSNAAGEEAVKEEDAEEEDADEEDAEEEDAKEEAVEEEVAAAGSRPTAWSRPLAPRLKEASSLGKVN